MEGTAQTPLKDLKKSALKDYDDASTKVHQWNSSIPRAIEFYFDYEQMSRWDKIKLAFKN